MARLTLAFLFVLPLAARAVTFEAEPVPEPTIVREAPASPTLTGMFAPEIETRVPDLILTTPEQTQAATAEPSIRSLQTTARSSAERQESIPEISETLFDGAKPAQRWARLVLLAQRAATLPAHLWPVNRAVNALSHGEALAGLTPRSAVRAAEAIKAARGAPVVVGRLSWELHDVWSVRGAARSYAKVIDGLAEAKRRDPGLDAAVSLDVEALGAQLHGYPLEARSRIAKANVEALARRARDAGIGVEFDVGASLAMPLLTDVAVAVVRDLNMPVRLALAARYTASGIVLRRWAALARETGLRLGVRLVKGSFIEGDQPGTVNFRRPLLERYKRLITEALGLSRWLDVAVATHNEEIWRHAQEESRRLGAPYSLQAIRGVNAPLQERMRASGVAPREYVSYGLDTPVMALMEMWTNWRQRRAFPARVRPDID